MKTFNNFKEYTPEGDVIEGAIYLKSDCGVDWYESQAMFDGVTIKLVVAPDGNIESVAQDASLLFPINCSVHEVDELPSGFELGLGYQYSDSQVVLPV